MSCKVLKDKRYEPPSLFSNIVRDADAAWGAVTRMITINRPLKDGFRIPDPPPVKNAKGGGVGYCYKKSGAMRK
jgi:hypothetical protein